MTDQTRSDRQSGTRLPDDDPTRTLTVVDPSAGDGQHVFMAGDSYTVLVTGAETNGRYCLIDMLVPDGGGPAPHRHDFEEMFTLLDGELVFTFRGESHTVRAPATVNIPANAPHFFRNTSGRPAHMLCMCTPAGQDAFFTAVGIPIKGRNGPFPRLTPAEEAAKIKQIVALAPAYRTEILPPA